MKHPIDKRREIKQKVLDFFKEFNQFDYTPARIKVGANVIDWDYDLLKEVLLELTSEGKIVGVRRFSGHPTYQLVEWMNEQKFAEMEKMAQKEYDYKY